MRTSLSKFLCLLVFASFSLFTSAQQVVNALSFDGVNDYVSLGNSATLKPTAALTVEAWVYSATWSTANGVIISNFDGTSGYRLQLVNGVAQATVYRNNTQVTVTFDLSAQSGWHHLRLYYGGSRYLRLYTDGSQRAQNDAGATYPIVYNSGTNTNIGSNTLANGDFFGGIIDELKVWAFATTPTNTSEVSIGTANLRAYYRFNQGIAGGTNYTTTNLDDLTTNGIDGTLNNFLLTGTSSNWVEGYALSPILQASQTVFSLQYGTSATISWQRSGANEGGNNVKVFLAQTSSTTATVPVAPGSDPAANSAYGSGGSLSSNPVWYCVYDGSGTSVNVTNLSAQSTYRAHVYEYQKSTGTTLRYSAAASGTNNPNNSSSGYLTPLTQASNLNFSNVAGTSCTVNWTRGDGTQCAVFMIQNTSGSASPVDLNTYSANSAFEGGDQIGSSGWYCVYKGTSNMVNITNLAAGLTYRAMVCEMNASTTIPYLERYLNSVGTNFGNISPDYLQPTTQTSNIEFSAITSTSATANFNSGNGTSRVAFVKQTNIPGDLPAISNNTTYAAGVYGSGLGIGNGWYCVYNSNGNLFNVTNLSPMNPYKVVVYDYNGIAGSEKYLTTAAVNNPNIVLPEYAAPQTQASDLFFTDFTGTSFTANWSNGDGERRIVFAREEDGSSFTAQPIDNTTYTANTNFGQGSMDDWGWYCIYDGTGSNTTIDNLTPGFTYRVMVCEYNGVEGSQKYNISDISNNVNTQTTDYLTPDVQGYGLSFSNISQNSFSINWNRGNGSNCAVFLKQTDSGSELASPFDYTEYSGNSSFTNGTQIDGSGWYCVYNGTGSSVDISNLAIATSYRAMVCEYNGTTGLEKYFASSATNNPANQLTNATSPTLQATNVSFVDDLNYPLSSTALHISWTNGNGSNRVVFMKQGNSGTVSVADGTSAYTANSDFMGTGSSNINEWYCVFNGSGNNVTVTGLTNTTNYQVQVFEYYYYLGEYRYNASASTGNPATGTTDFVSPVGQASGLSVTSITPTGFTVSWVNADPSAGTNVFIANALTGNPTPVTNTTYNIDATLATNWRAVYRGTGTSTTVSGLTPGQSYKLIAFAYNGTAGKEKYNSSTAANNPFDNNTTLSGTTWNGSAWNYGTPDATLDAVIDGNGCPANFTAKNLTINVGSTFNIPAGQSVTVNGNLLNDGRIYLRLPNSMGAAGSLITNGIITSNDSVFAERYITAGTTDAGNQTWHFLGSPVSSSFEVSKTFALDYVASYTHPSFLALKKGDNINPRIGYRVKTVSASDSKMLLFGGISFNTGSQTFTINSATNAFTLISNPYPSAIDWNAASGLTRTNVYNYTWIWNPIQNVYAIWNGSTGTNGASSIIPAMQGFYVCTSGASPALAMNNNIRLHSTTATMSNNASDLIRLSVSGNGSKDEVLFHNLPIENVGYKMFSPVGYVPQLSVYQNDKEFAMLGIDANIRDTLIYLGFTCEEKGEFEFKLEKFNLNTNQYLYIIDSKTGLASKISESSGYKFNYEPGDNKTRFKLLVGTDTEIVNSVLNKQINIADIWSFDNKVVVNLKLEGRNTIRIFNLQGVEVMNSLQQNSKLFQYELGKTGIYVVSVTNNMGTTTKKVFIK